jgi:phage N-6-adenine-methyltransferase
MKIEVDLEVRGGSNNYYEKERVNRTRRESMNTAAMFSSKTDEWSTPQDFFDELNKEFNFTLDPCATPENAKCEKYYTKEDDGLKQDWSGETVFCNPPYGRAIKDWVKKCYEESKKPNTTVVMLIPARTDTSYFHDYIYHKAKEIRFIRGRLKFGNAKNSAPFPSMVVIF